MKKNDLAKRGLALLAAAGLLTGCGSQAASVADAKNENDSVQEEVNVEQEAAAEETTEDAAEDAAEEPTEKIKIVAATSGTGPRPYVYSDEQNNITGYDIELLREIFSRLPQYELEIVPTGTIFEGLDAGYYDIAVNHFGFNKERGEKYLFSDVYAADTHAILVREDSDIQSIEDLPGHSTESSVGSNNAIIFEAYNEEHPDNPVILNYTENANTELRVANGELDFEFFTKKYLEEKVEELGIKNVKLIDVSVADKDSWTNTVTGTFYIFPKNKQDLADDVNAALEDALADGTVDKLIKEYIGESDIPITQEFIEQQRARIAEISGN